MRINRDYQVTIYHLRLQTDVAIKPRVYIMEDLLMSTAQVKMFVGVNRPNLTRSGGPWVILLFLTIVDKDLLESDN